MEMLRHADRIENKIMMCASVTKAQIFLYGLYYFLENSFANVTAAFVQPLSIPAGEHVSAWNRHQNGEMNL